MIQIGTYVHGGSNYEEKIIAIKNAGFDFVALGMGALSDGTLEYQVELCQKYGLPIDNIHLTGGKTTEIWFEGELGDKVCDRYCREIKMAADAGIKKGHGGMDFLVLDSFITAIKDGTPVPIDIYDSAILMAVTPLSEQSIKQGGAPMAFPDLTAGIEKRAVAEGKYRLF